MPVAAFAQSRSVNRTVGKRFFRLNRRGPRSHLAENATPPLFNRCGRVRPGMVFDCIPRLNVQLFARVLPILPRERLSIVRQQRLWILPAKEHSVDLAAEVCTISEVS